MVIVSHEMVLRGRLKIRLGRKIQVELIRSFVIAALYLY